MFNEIIIFLFPLVGQFSLLNTRERYRTQYFVLISILISAIFYR